MSEQLETMVIENVTYITLADFARTHELSGDRLRDMARAEKIEATRQVFGVWVIPVDAPVPDTSTRGPARADGRLKYIGYFTPDELVAVKAAAPEAEFIDPRAKRAAQRAAKAAEEATTE